MGKEIEALAKFVAETKWEDIPERVQRHAKTVLLDTIGVILAGSARPEVATLRKRLAPNAGSGATIYAPGFASHDPRTAALLNGIGGRAIELCEGLRLVSGQAGIQILPGLLATGEAMDRSGRDLLAALVLGYEVAGRLASAHTPRPLAHQNGQASLVAAAAGGARIRGMSAAETSLAMRVSTTLVLTPSYTNAVAGATALNVAGGMSSFVGVLASELVVSGFTAQPDAVEEALGKLVGDGFRAESLLEGLGTRWHITENYFRLYACCNPIHPALDSLRHVLGELKAKPQEIDRIDIATYRFASVMRNPDPPNFFASKYSLPHVAAVLAVKGRAGHSDVGDEALADPEIVALRHRVHVTEDAAMSAVAPKLRPARVTVKLKDGREATHACESHRGDFNRPFEDSELRAKFHELAEHVVSPETAKRAEEAICRAEALRSVRELVTLLKEDAACST